MASFTVKLRFPSSVTLTGFSLANSCLISLTCAVVISCCDAPVFVAGTVRKHGPGFCLFLPGRAERSPTFHKVKHSGLCFCLLRRLGADAGIIPQRPMPMLRGLCSNDCAFCCWRPRSFSCCCTSRCRSSSASRRCCSSRSCCAFCSISCTRRFRSSALHRASSRCSRS